MCWLCWVFVAVWAFLSLCTGLSLCWRFLALASLAEHRLQGMQAPEVVVAHRLSCSTAFENFLDQGSDPCLLH